MKNEFIDIGIQCTSFIYSRNRGEWCKFLIILAFMKEYIRDSIIFTDQSKIKNIVNIGTYK